MYGAKIKMIRELRGFSQEYMAGKLGIAQNTYSKIETNQSKLSAEMLENVAKELGVSPIDIISHEPTVVNLASNHGTQGIGYVEHFYNFQKEFVEKIIASKDVEIDKLHRVIEGLLKDKEHLMDILTKRRE